MKTGTFHMVDRVPETCKLKMVFRLQDRQGRKNNQVEGEISCKGVHTET